MLSRWDQEFWSSYGSNLYKFKGTWMLCILLHYRRLWPVSKQQPQLRQTNEKHQEARAPALACWLGNHGWFQPCWVWYLPCLLTGLELGWNHIADYAVEICKCAIHCCYYLEPMSAGSSEREFLCVLFFDRFIFMRKENRVPLMLLAAVKHLAHRSCALSLLVPLLFSQWHWRTGGLSEVHRFWLWKRAKFPRKSNL